MAGRKRVTRTQLVEFLWQSRYPIVIPTYRRDYVIPLFFLIPCACFGFWILVQDDWALNVFRGWLLFLGGTGFSAFLILTLLLPGWRRMVIHEDHAQTPFRRIHFYDVELFEAGYPVRIRYSTRSPLERFRNRFRLTQSLPSRYVVGSYGLAHLLNRALDDYRTRRMRASPATPTSRVDESEEQQ